MTTMIVGDVHGMLSELTALVNLLDPKPSDTVVFVGDLIDKGPDSAGVVGYVRELSERCKVVLVEGNHEDKHKRYRKNLVERPEVAQQQAEKSSELPAITSALLKEDVEFLEGAVPFFRTEAGTLVVHGGIPGDMMEFPATPDEASSLKGKAKRNFGKTLRTRFISKETGKFLALDQNAPEDPFWAEAYDGRFGTVAFGHEPFISDRGKPVEFNHAIGLDCGAVFGGHLTAMIEVGPVWTFANVKCAKFCEAKVE